MKPQTVLKSLIVVTLFTLAGTALSAGAADITLLVPVRLSSMPAALTESVTVTCVLSTARAPEIRRRSVSITIPESGNYAGTVRVEFDAAEFASETNGYRCWIYPYPHRAGTTPILSVSGDIR
jgi:hypothetical protein